MNRRLLPALLPLMLLFSCTIYREYTIEVYKPGEVAVAPEVKNAAIVYRNFKYPGDTLQNYFRKDNQLIKTNDRTNSDSLLTSLCMNELAINLKNHNIFEEVPVFPYHTFERHTGENLTDLPAELINRLASDASAALLISLETFSTFFATYPETKDTPLTNEVVYVAVWGIYDPGKNRLIERKTMVDTLYWNGYDNEGNLLQNYMPPPRNTALELASAMAGERFARRFYAGWQTEKRMYSVPPLPDFADAAVLFEEEKWDEAIFVWKKYAADRNGKMAIDARYNLALAYELKDDLETALQWLVSAQKLAASYRSKTNLQMIQLYQKTLQERQSDVLKIEQVNNEKIH